MSFRSSNMEIGREGCSSSAQNALPLPEKCYPIIPGTPMKTDQVRIHWMESGDYDGSDRCLHETKRRKEESGSRSAAAVRRAIEFNSMGNKRRMQNHGNQDAAASQVLAFPDAASAMAAAAAAMQMASNAVGGFTPILLAQINGGMQQQQQQQQSTAPAMCIVNQNIPYIWNPWSNSTIQAPPMPPNSFQLYDLNCPPQTAIADAVSNRTISLQMGPVTPDRSRTPQNSQYGAKAINLSADGVDQEEPQEESFPPGFSDAMRGEVAVDRDQVFSHHLDSLNRVISTAVKSSHGLSQIFDSSSTVPSTPAKLNPSLLHGLDSSPAAVPTPAKENDGFFQTFDPSQTIPLTNAGEKQDFSELSHLLHAFLSSPSANKDNQDVSQPSKLPSASFSTSVQDNQGISYPLDSSPTVTPSVEENSEQNEREDQGVKQNATPQQKQKPPRRKKHRPKVVVEGKPKRTPKPKTPKQDSSKENPSGKRKYVRRTGPKAPSTHPNADTDAGQNINAAIAADTKSCKRALNFDSEVQTAKQHHTEIFQQGNPNGGTDSVASEAMAPTWNFSSDLSVGINSPGSKSTVQLAKGLEVVVEKSSAGIQIDLNRSFTEMLDESISLPEYLSPPATVKEPSNCNRNIDIEKMVQQFGDAGEACQYIHTGKQQNSLQSPVNRNEQNSNINMQQVGSKREYNHIAHDAILHPMNILENHKQACQKIIENNKSYVNNGNYGMHFPGIYKRKRTSISHKEPAIKTPPSTTMYNGAGRTSAIAPNGVARPTVCSSMNGSMNSLLTLDTGVRSSLFQGNVMEEAKSNASNRYRGMHPISGEIYQTLHRISRGVISWFNDPMGVEQQDFDGVLDDCPVERRIKKKGNRSFHTRRLPSLYAAKTDPCNPQACVEALAADNQAKPKRKRRTKKAPPSNIAPHSGMSPHPLHQGTLTYDLCQHFIQKRATSLGQIPAGVGSPLQALIDEISQRLEYLNINGYSKTIPDQAQKALIPYVGGGVMVPYGGTLDHTKKRRPRAKVDLDAETERVWKLLMWQVNNNGTEGTDADKEKYWEEERQRFMGRVDSFIARMRLVQGDRRFSPWKGSVVDSVVGVFLTQNVSDHLSSSAFMALAARFPLQSRSKDTAPNNEMRSTASDESGYNIELDDDSKSQDKISGQQVCNQGSLHRADPFEEQEVANSNESFASNVGGGIANHSKGNHHISYMSGPAMCQESPVSRTGTATTVIDSANPVDAEDRKAFDDIISSQISVVSSQNSTESTPNAPDRIGSSSESNSEVENPVTEFKCDPFDSTTSFTELLEMLNVVCSSGHGGALSTENCEGTSGQLEGSEYNNGRSICGVDGLKDPYPFIERANSHHPQKQHAIDSMLSIQSSSNQLHEDLNLGPTEVECMVVLKEESLSKSFMQKPSNSLAESCCVKHPLEHNNLPRERTEVQSGIDSLDHIAQRQNYRMQHSSPKLPSHLRDESSVAECSSLGNKGKATERKLAEPNAKIEGHSSKTASTEMTADTSKAKRGKGESSKKKDIDWDSLRRQTCCNGQKKERSSDRMDTLDWEAVRLAEVSEISNTIRARGMNNMLAERIKDFLNRLVREHGSIDLEWLRDVPPDKVKDFLLSVRGLGLKSVECVRLLTLHHLAFPVDTNVGRICVRLGWVPLQPLPESLQLHLLELYPMLETIQKYLWPRLCTLDQRTLYELHYQMITFGKVFCTKSKPNCNACPMRAECKHFASAFASAKLALPGPEEKRLASSTVPITVEQEPKMVIYPLPLPLPEGNPCSQDPKEYAHLQDAGNPQLQGPTNTSCEPIIEEPPSPEPARIELTETDIEDAVWEEDPEEIPEIKINMDVLTTNVQNILQQKNMELQEGDLSKALVALTPEAASIPAPKLKNAGRLRTEHTVYELPDSHPLLKGLDRREHDDPCSYLFAMWTPGETPQSTEPPKSCGNSQPGNLCNDETCLSCNSIREANAQIVRGTLLIPCRTAMRGSFPLNGTYFQVNEVFADHDSSLKPIDVPRSWVWYLNTRTVYFGTSIPTIFKGLTTEDIQRCFWKGYVCVRGFDRKTRAPRPLIARLHIPASKLEKNKKTTGEE